jgi:hypothetical protein
MLNFDIYNLKREKHNLEPLIRGFHFFTIMIQVVYVDIEEYILTLSSSRKEEELDETMLQLKKIISNE